MVIQGDRVIVVTHKKLKMTILWLHLFSVLFYSLKYVPTNLSSKWGREGITTSRKQVRKLRVQDAVSEQPRQTLRLWTSVTIMLMGVGKQGKSCLICLDRLDLVCQQDTPSRHPKMQRQSGLKRSALKMSLRSYCGKVSLKQASLLGRKCRQKRGSLKQALVRRDLYLEAKGHEGSKQWMGKERGERIPENKRIGGWVNQ